MTTTGSLPAGPRQPRALQTLRFGLDPYGFFESAHRRFGDVFTVRVMADTWVVLAHPDAVRELVAIGPQDADSGVANRSLVPLLGLSSSLLLDGEEHLRRRKLLLPPLHGERMRAYEDLIRERTRREIATWPEGKPIATLPGLRAITLQVVLGAVFGMQDGPALDRLGASLQRLVAWTTDPRRGLVFAFLGPRRLMSLPGFGREVADVDDQLLALIARRRRAADLAERDDVLSMLVQARHDDGTALTDRELRDELMTLLVAGHETTAAALSWTLTEVARHPATQTRLAAGEPGLAEAAVSETLRLHPPVPLGSLRRLRRPITLAGRTLPAGATVATCSVLIHRRPDVYEDPLAWRPDRFLGTRPPAGAWLPFGGGVRRCVGAAFAQFEARTVLEELVRAVELHPTGRRSARVARRGIVLVPPRGGPVVPAFRHLAPDHRPQTADARSSLHL
jgi:cytochrome P450